MGDDYLQRNTCTVYRESLLKSSSQKTIWPEKLNFVWKHSQTDVVEIKVCSNHDPLE